jgi:hypothetical protein
MYKHNNKGVSETIGFIIILGIVITGIALVTLSGYPMLLQQQQNANVRNMEKNMIVLQSEQNLLTYKGVPYRETSMQVSGGTLRVINPNPSPPNPLGPGSSKFWINTNVWNYGTSVYETDVGNSTSLNPGLLEYSANSANEIIALQNGAVVTNGFSEGGSTMLSEPRWFVDGTTLVVSFITIQSVGDLSSTGIGTVQMSVTQDTSIDYKNSDNLHPPQAEIHYAYIPDGYKDAWKNFFQNKQVFGSSSTYYEIGGASPEIYVTISGLNRIVIKHFTITVHNL